MPKRASPSEQVAEQADGPDAQEDDGGGFGDACHAETHAIVFIRWEAGVSGRRGREA